MAMTPNQVQTQALLPGAQPAPSRPLAPARQFHSGPGDDPEIMALERERARGARIQRERAAAEMQRKALARPQIPGNTGPMKPPTPAPGTGGLKTPPVPGGMPSRPLGMGGSGPFIPPPVGGAAPKPPMAAPLGKGTVGIGGRPAPGSGPIIADPLRPKPPLV